MNTAREKIKLHQTLIPSKCWQPHISSLAALKTLPNLLSLSSYSSINSVPEVPPPYFGFLFSFCLYISPFFPTQAEEVFSLCHRYFRHFLKYWKGVCKTITKNPYSQTFSYLQPSQHSPELNLVYLLLIINTDILKPTTSKSPMTLSLEWLLWL